LHPFPVEVLAGSARVLDNLRKHQVVQAISFYVFP
jgi:hypothetical protein